METSTILIGIVVVIILLIVLMQFNFLPRLPFFPPRADAYSSQFSPEVRNRAMF